MNQPYPPNPSYPPQKPPQDWAHSNSSKYQYLPLNTVGLLLRVAVAGCCLLFAISTGMEIVGGFMYPGFNDLNAPLSGPDEENFLKLTGLVGLSILPFTLFAGITTCIFMYRANANLRSLGVRDLEFTPGWCGGWWFVPFANLFKPYQALSEIQQKSASRPTNEMAGMMGWWWGFWILAGFANRIASRMYERLSTEVWMGINICGTVLTILAGVLFILIIGRIAEDQSRRVEPANSAYANPLR